MHLQPGVHGRTFMLYHFRNSCVVRLTVKSSRHQCPQCDAVTCTSGISRSLAGRNIAPTCIFAEDAERAAHLGFARGVVLTLLYIDSACATMDAGSLLLAGSSSVVPALAMPPKAVRYCSAMRMLAASLPPSALHHGNESPQWHYQNVVTPALTEH